jgi:hypothetical protein
MRFWILNSLLFCIGFAFGQAPERKIIIENGTYHYVTINDNNQLATYYRGATTSPIKEGKRYVLPVGRNLTAHFNPLAWDLKDDSIVAVNFMDHVMNDRYEAIKKIGLFDLQEWNSTMVIGELIQACVDQPQYIFNQPYLSLKEKTDIFNHFYFDLALIGDEVWMVMSNEGSFRIWKYADGEWKKSKIYKREWKAHFTLVKEGNKPMLLTETGEKIVVSLDGVEIIQQGKNNFELKDYTVVIDRDNGKNYYIKNNFIIPEQSITELLKKSGNTI